MRILIICLLALTLFSCKDETVVDPIPSAKKLVLIANEGNFGWGDGSLSVYDPEAKEIANQVYTQVNDESIGNVFQSIAFYDHHFYMVVNNSAKIIVTDTNYSKVGEINGFNSPRYIYPLKNDQAYVTDLYANKLWLIDLKSFSIIDHIEINGWLESGVLIDSIFYVGAMESDQVYEININTHMVIDSIKFSYANQSLVLDENDHLWVLSQGDGDTKKGKISAYDIIQDTIDFSIEIGNESVNLRYDKTESRLLYIQDNIRQLNVNTKIDANFINSQNSTFYGLEVDQTTGEIYLSDVQDFVSRSTIYRYNKDAMLIHEFKADIISGDFLIIER